ncbi:MAG: helix-turn-helix transcriptional regulator [Desulfobacterales bacterium]|nr:helix-turn-helix transcriptional regulator [Desulfobacterales bacterium]
MTPSLGDKIRQLRQEQGLSQVLLEKKSGVNSKLLSKYENGRIIPTADTLRKIAEGLETSADYLIFDNVPKAGLSQIEDLDLFEKFKEVEQMDAENKNIIKSLIEAIIIKNKVCDVMRSKNSPWEDRIRQTLSKLRKRARGYSEDDIMRIVDESVRAVRLEEKNV